MDPIGALDSSDGDPYTGGCRDDKEHISGESRTNEVFHWDRGHETAQVLNPHNVNTAWIERERAREESQWIFRVIQGKQEADKVLVNHPDFLLLPNKFVHKGRINLMVIFKDPTLHSVRSLRADHLPLLKAVKAMIEEYVGGADNMRQLMLCFHYPPSVWQLHLHVISTADAVRTAADMQREVFLSNVIYRLTIDGSYFEKLRVRQKPQLRQQRGKKYSKTPSGSHKKQQH